jgi:hypothetical protein
VQQTAFAVKKYKLGLATVTRIWCIYCSTGGHDGAISSSPIESDSNCTSSASKNNLVIRVLVVSKFASMIETVPKFARQPVKKNGPSDGG